MGEIEIVDLLIQSGARIEASDPLYGFTPLLSAAACGQSSSLKRLLDANASVNVVRGGSSIGSGETALIAASEGGHVDCVLLLLEAGASLEAKSKVGTALMHAIEGGHVSILEMLIEAGANVNTLSSDGRTALVISRQRLKKNIRMVKMLQDAGAKRYA